MRLTVLIPSPEYRSNAGARIRYERLRTELAAVGCNLTLDDIGTFNPTKAECDVLLVSKCHDARSLVAAAAMSDRGVLVGPDLFDDYYSDPTDSRLFRYREWLSQLVKLSDFALCSTEVMAGVAHEFRSDLPTHILNDPAPAFDPQRLSGQLARKLADAEARGQIRIAWFGVGDNPFFDVGLSDLCAHAGLLDELSRTGMRTDLTVLTNRRSLSADGLALISRLPIKTRILEWSEDTEQNVLADSLAVFLPVNAQPFSRAKTLNRAFTALCSGCQVLSAGYPLYAALDRFIYRDCKGFADDLARKSLRLSAQMLDQFRKAAEMLAGAKKEAHALAAFFNGLKLCRGPRAPLRLALIHGHGTRSEAHEFVHAVNGFSIASPYCSANLDFDMVFGSADGMEMLVTPAGSVRLELGAHGQPTGISRTFWKRFLPRTYLGGGSRSDGFSRGHWHDKPIAFQLATYTETMAEIERQVRRTLGPSRVIFSETSPLPFRLAIPGG